ncbi:glycosyltransferase [Sinomicrobium oceani]|uniref:glycosyltransferase n=1 Tax=Sinomicrobium oceani TaxID=1150368 RepID=UPI00227B5005|nr:glycosyltransferase [Sinomicrobium oceani]
MKLSVCIFTYNHQAYIAETIEGALRQKTNFEFEIVVGEDCSTDGTRQIVEQYEKCYPQKVRAIYNKTNLGMMSNNSNTILQCKGDYIALLDGDDYWIDDKKLQNQVEFMDNNPKYSFCFHDGKILGKDGVLLDETCCGYMSKEEVKFEDVIFDVSIPTFSIVFRRNLLGGYPPSWFHTLNAPDRPLFLLLAQKGKGYYFNQCWGVYRLHDNGCWTGQNYQSRWLTHLQIFNTINSYYDQKYDKAFSKAKNKVYYILAIQLSKDGKLKRSVCFLKKFMTSHKSSLMLKLPFFRKLFVCYMIMFKYFLRSKLKTG